MALSYIVVVQETKPTNRQPGSFWFINSVGLLLRNMGNDKYNPMSAGEANLAIANGVYYKETTQSTTAPVAPSPLDIWHQSNASNIAITAWVYIGKWIPYGGG